MPLYVELAQLKEDDNPWDFDSLLQSVTQEFNAEKRLKLNAEAHGGGPRSSSISLQGSGSQMQGGGSRRPGRALIS